MENQTLTKKKAIDKISRKHGMHPDEVRSIVQDFLDLITEELSKGNRFEFRDFGVFEVVRRKEKVGRNPKAPEKTVAIPACNAAKFTPGKRLKKLVGSNKA